MAFRVCRETFSSAAVKRLKLKSLPDLKQANKKKETHIKNIFLSTENV